MRMCNRLLAVQRGVLLPFFLVMRIWRGRFSLTLHDPAAGAHVPTVHVEVLLHVLCLFLRSTPSYRGAFMEELKEADEREAGKRRGRCQPSECLLRALVASVRRLTRDMFSDAISSVLGHYGQFLARCWEPMNG